MGYGSKGNLKTKSLYLVEKFLHFFDQCYLNFTPGRVWDRALAMAIAQNNDQHTPIGGVPEVLPTFAYKSGSGANLYRWRTKK